MSHRTLIPIFALALAATPLAAQEPPPGPPPGVERLERLRLERMQRVLDLTDREIAAVERQMDENRESMRSAMEAQRDAMERLREEIGDEPVDQEAVRRALADVEARREAIERLRDEHHARIAESLTPEQQAKLLFFSHEFEGRLHELIQRHRAPGQGFRGAPAHGLRRPTPGQQPGAGPGFDRRVPGREMDREAQIQRLRRQIEVLQERLAQLEALENE